MKQDTQKPALELKHVGAEEEGVVLENISLTAVRGETLVIAGLHPAFLRLLRKVIRGQSKSLSGSIEAEGRTIRPQQLQKLTVGILDRGEVFPDLTIAENICISCVNRIRLSSKKEKEYALGLIDRYHLDINLSKSVNELSSMDRLMVQVLQSIASDKPVMVFFDCMSGLGPHEKKAFHSILRDMKEKGKAIIYITGTLSDALFVGDRIAAMRNGTITSVRTAREAGENVRELMHELSGWSILDEEEGGGIDAVRAFVESREVMTSSRELNHSLEYLAEDMKKIFKADRVLICLTDQFSGEVFDFIEFPYRNKNFNRANDALVCEVIRNDQMQVVVPEDEPMGRLFDRHDDMGMLVCQPIVRPGKVCALLMIFHKKLIEPDEMNRFYLTSFAKEIAIALETSELLGRSTLLQESHHRIKNNLQMINSLIYLQRQAVRQNKMNPDEAFQAISRHVSLIAVVHDILSNDTEKESIINLATIIRELVKMYAHSGIRLTLDLENVSIPYNKATMLSMVVNELLTNSVKYAFRGREEEENEIYITLSNDGAMITLVIADNGMGFSKDEKPKGSGLGIGLIWSIIGSIRGTLEVESSPAGTRSVVTLPVSRVYDVGNSIG